MSASPPRNSPHVKLDRDDSPQCRYCGLSADSEDWIKACPMNIKDRFGPIRSSNAHALVDLQDFPKTVSQWNKIDQVSFWSDIQLPVDSKSAADIAQLSSAKECVRALLKEVAEDFKDGDKGGHTRSYGDLFINDSKLNIARRMLIDNHNVVTLASQWNHCSRFLSGLHGVGKTYFLRHMAALLQVVFGDRALVMYKCLQEGSTTSIMDALLCAAAITNFKLKHVYNNLLELVEDIGKWRKIILFIDDLQAKKADLRARETTLRGHLNIVTNNPNVTTYMCGSAPSLASILYAEGNFQDDKLFVSHYLPPRTYAEFKDAYDAVAHRDRRRVPEGQTEEQHIREVYSETGGILRLLATTREDDSRKGKQLSANELWTKSVRDGTILSLVFNLLYEANLSLLKAEHDRSFDPFKQASVPMVHSQLVALQNAISFQSLDNAPSTRTVVSDVKQELYLMADSSWLYMDDKSNIQFLLPNHFDEMKKLLHGQLTLKQQVAIRFPVGSLAVEFEGFYADALKERDSSLKPDDTMDLKMSEKNKWDSQWMRDNALKVMKPIPDNMGFDLLYFDLQENVSTTVTGPKKPKIETVNVITIHYFQIKVGKKDLTLNMVDLGALEDFPVNRIMIEMEDAMIAALSRGASSSSNKPLLRWIVQREPTLVTSKDLSKRVDEWCKKHSLNVYKARSPLDWGTKVAKFCEDNLISREILFS